MNTKTIMHNKIIGHEIIKTLCWFLLRSFFFFNDFMLILKFLNFKGEETNHKELKKKLVKSIMIIQ